MLSRVKSVLLHPNIQQFRDVRVLGLIVFCLISLLVTYSGLGAVQSNYKLRQQIAKIEDLNAIQELENNNKRLRNQYYKTDEFLELQARQLFGKAAPGETVIVIPKETALKYTDEPSKESPAETLPYIMKPFYQRNIESWTRFFLHR